MSRSGWVLASMLAMLTLFAGTTFQTTTAVLLGFVVAVVIVWGRPTGPRLSPRWETSMPWIAAALALIWRATRYTGDNVNPLSAFADMTTHAALAISLGWWVLRPGAGHFLMLGAGLTIVFHCVIAGGISHTLVNQITVGIVTCGGFVLASQLILSRGRREVDWCGSSAAHGITAAGVDAPGPGSASEAASSNAAPADTHTVIVDTPRGPSERLPHAALVISLLLVGTTVMAQGTDHFLTQIQQTLQQTLNVSIDSLTENLSISGTRYVRGSRLGSLRSHMLGSPDEVALRCYAQSSPGYLRGTVFRDYQNRNWFGSDRDRDRGRDRDGYSPERMVQSTQAGRTLLSGPHHGTLRQFDLRLPSTTGVGSSRGTVDYSREQVVEVHNRPEKGLVVFNSHATDWIEASADRLRVNSDNAVIGGINLMEPYVINVHRVAPRQTLTAGDREELLRIDPTLREVTADVVRQVCSVDSSPREKAIAIENHFRNRFSYALDHRVDGPAGVDPIVHFLETRHPAHCEYFASAACLLLRQAGVPTRYVTGYVVQEISDDELYYLARNRDAHAWVEAFDEGSGQWFAVEATPGRRYSTVRFVGEENGDEQSIGDGQDVNAGVGEGWWSVLTDWLYQTGATDMAGMLLRIGQVPLLIVSVAYLYLRRRVGGATPEDAAEASRRRRLLQIDREVGRHGWVRANDETLHQFADRIQRDWTRIDARHGGDARATAAEWAGRYRRFAVEAYAASPQTPGDDRSGQGVVA